MHYAILANEALPRSFGVILTSKLIAEWMIFNFQIKMEAKNIIKIYVEIMIYL